MPIKQQRVIKTTLGELVVAVTDEVMPLVREPSALYPAVSYIFNNVLTRRRRRVHTWSRGKYSSCLGNALTESLCDRGGFTSIVGRKHE